MITTSSAPPTSAADHKALLSQLLGTPDPATDDAETARARAAFDRGELDEAMRLFPRHHGMERRVLHRLIKSHRPSAAVWSIDEKLRRLWVSALQSRLFNEVVAKRIESLDRLFVATLPTNTRTAPCFLGGGCRPRNNPAPIALKSARPAR